jgi:hypothetical protein
MTDKGWYSLVARAVLIAGVGFSLVGLGEGIYFPYFQSHALRANGTISDLVREEDKGSVYLCPQFSFQTPDGHGYKVTSNNCDSSEFSVGQSVSILYKPSDPTDAFIDSPEKFSARWAFKMGAVDLLIAIPLFWYARRRGIPIRWLDGWSS